MAPKRPSPLEDPPSASSSSSSSSDAESENISEKEEQEQQIKGNAKSEEEEEESEEEEEEEEEENKKPSVRKPTPIATPQPQSSSDSEGSGSEFYSGGSKPSPTASDFTIKPIVSKPMDDTAKPKKPTSKPPAPASKPAAKRPTESEQNGKESQKKSKVANGDEEDGAVEEKKSAIHRLWSEDDEIVILKGLIEYQSKKGADADMGAFHEFIKKFLHVDVSKNQLMDKIRRLKKKYQNNAEKGEKGDDPVFTKPHEHKAFELSKKIWGGGAGNPADDNAKSTNKKARKSVKVNNSPPLPKEDAQEPALQEELNGEVKDLKVDQVDFWCMYPRMQDSLESEKSLYLSMSEPGKNFMKEMMSMIGSSKAKELEEKWKNLRVDEVALYLKRIELIREQTKLMLDAMKSSKS